MVPDVMGILKIPAIGVPGFGCPKSAPLPWLQALRSSWGQPCTPVPGLANQH